MSTYETAAPGTALVGQATLNAKTAYQKALAQINQRRSATMRQAGYRGDINADTGTIENMRVDSSNQYGQFQQLRRSHAQQDEAARWGAQERGLGAGGGLAAQMVNDTRYGFGAQDAQFGQDLIGQLQGYQGQQDAAVQDRDRTMYEAQLEAARQAIDSQQWNPANYAAAGQDYADYGETGYDAFEEDYADSGADPTSTPQEVVGKGKNAVLRAYNKAAYVPGGSSAKVAKAIQAKGYQSAKQPAKKKILPTRAAAIGSAASYRAAARPIVKTKKKGK